MALDIETIKKFIDKMGMTISIVPHESSSLLCITLKVLYKKKIQYLVDDCFRITKDGKPEWKDSEFFVMVGDGVFSYLGDSNAIDNYFLELTTNYANKFMNDKISS